MDPRIFGFSRWACATICYTSRWNGRTVYDPQQNVLFVNLSHYTVKTAEDVEQIRATVAQRLSRLDKKVYAIVNYDGFRIDPDLINATRYGEVAHGPLLLV